MTGQAIAVDFRPSGTGRPAVLDSSQPWAAHLQPGLFPVLADWADQMPVADALTRAMPGPPPLLPAGPLRFVPQADLPAGEAYEAFIHRTASVPTRNNLHDLFNGLVWLAQPALKARLNALQAAEIARVGIGAQRGRLRDALTLFDENGAVLDGPAGVVDDLLAALVADLRARNWTALFITHRARWAAVRLTLIGHALLEQLASAPRKPLTAHVLVLDPLRLSAEDWASKPFLPLPVLGVPGWWPANEAPDFYADAAVFRPLRRR